MIKSLQGDLAVRVCRDTEAARQQHRLMVDLEAV
jgi:hypothetical protein